MRDVFYTILVVWLLYRIWEAFTPKKNFQQPNHSKKKEGEVTIENMNQKKNSSEDKGDYVDYEEVK
jgi:hypothetical protein